MYYVKTQLLLQELYDSFKEAAHLLNESKRVETDFKDLVIGTNSLHMVSYSLCNHITLTLINKRYLIAFNASMWNII